MGNDPARPKTVTFSHREEGSAKAHRLDEKEALLAKLEDETDFEHTVVTVPEPVVGGLLPAALVERGAWLCPARSRVVDDKGTSEAPMSPRLTEEEEDLQEEVF